MDEHLDRFAPALPFASAVLELADEFLFLGVHRDDRLAATLKLPHAGVDVLELGVAVGVLAAFFGLAVGLQAVAQALEQPSDRAGTHAMARARQLPGQARRALARPAQSRLRVPARGRIDQRFQSGQHPRVCLGGAQTARARPAQPHRQRGGGVGFSRLEFRQTFGNGVGRQACHAMERPHAPSAVGLGLSRRQRSSIKEAKAA